MTTITSKPQASCFPVSLEPDAAARLAALAAKDGMSMINKASQILNDTLAPDDSSPHKEGADDRQELIESATKGVGK